MFEIELVDREAWFIDQVEILEDFFDVRDLNIIWKIRNVNLTVQMAVLRRRIDRVLILESVGLIEEKLVFLIPLKTRKVWVMLTVLEKRLMLVIESWIRLLMLIHDES
jgi:hypothetical protein